MTALHRQPVLAAFALVLVVRASSVSGTEESEPTLERELRVGKDDGGLGLLNSGYLHAHYTFSLARQNMKRQGTGELWLSFADNVPRMRLKGAASSPRFGDGEITIVVDSAERTMYALFKLGELHEAQCVKYPFPDRDKNVERLSRLQWRREQVMKWQEQEVNAKEPLDKKLLTVNWTSSYELEFLLSHPGNEVLGVDLRQGPRIIKTVRLDGEPETSQSVPADQIGAFGPPAENCTLASDIENPLARVELKPPHRKSSALNDLLLVLSDRTTSPEEWPQLFVMLSAIMVPGDVAVMIEDPLPPDMEALTHVAFDYTAEVISLGGAATFNDPAADISQNKRHTSDGSIWLNLADRAFHLRGEAKATKVGPLFMDLIARGGDAPKVYANVNITVQEEQQCIAYEYPELNEKAKAELKDISNQTLSFFAIAELRGEDCGIFMAPLARGRWIHLWVDMESDNPSAILRSEIHKGGQILRRTDVKRWHTGAEIVVEVQPEPEWSCQEGPGTGQIAHLGLSQVHKRSIELQDALYALRSLSRKCALLEVLGLTGDVAMMVQEPELPELWRLPAVSFSYSVYLGPANGDPAAGKTTYTAGNFAADLQNGRVRMTAGAMTPGATNISVALEPGILAVRIEDPSLSEPQCLTLPLEEGDAQRASSGGERAVAAGVFDGVEAIGESECNRFTFRGTGTHSESVEFWFSKLEDAVCRLEVLPPAGDDGSGMGALINVPAWEAAYVPGSSGGDKLYNDALAAAPAGWNCLPAAKAQKPWLSLKEEASSSALPASVALAKLAEASGVVGLLTLRAANTLSRLVITQPSVEAPPEPPPKPQPQVSIFGPELQQFGFSFSSMYPVEGKNGGGVSGVASTHNGVHRGSGELRVDLAQRRLYMRSHAVNVSAGIRQVESRVIFRGDRGRLYARTKMDDEGFEQCWSVRTVEAVPTPADSVHSNPFSRGKLAGKGISVPDVSAHGVERLAEKYVYYLDQKKAVELFVDDRSALVAINLDDLHRGVSAGILIGDWSTAPIDDGWFEPTNDWKCEDLQFLEYAEQIAEWDLIRVFFPPQAAPAAAPVHEESSRRLFSV